MDVFYVICPVIKLDILNVLNNHQIKNDGTLKLAGSPIGKPIYVLVSHLNVIDVSVGGVINHWMVGHVSRNVTRWFWSCFS